METEIVVAVDDVPSECDALQEACRLARGGGRLTVLMVHRPLGEWADGALMIAGVDPQRLRVETEMEQRGALREALGRAGVGTAYQLEVIRRQCPDERLDRLFRASTAIVLPATLTRVLRQIRRAAERAGLEPIIVSKASLPAPVV